MRGLAMAALAAAVALSLGSVELTEDKPPLPPAFAGDVTGSIQPADQVAGLKALCRDSGKSYSPSSFDRKSGRFAFKGLPGDAAYDLVLALADGRTLEGIDLGFVDGRFLRLAEARRKELNLPPEREHVFSSQDVKDLLAFVRDLKDFMEIRRVLYVRGEGRRATMLVELMRAREFYAQKGGELIWRVELWYFQDEFGGWDRLPNQERVLQRLRVAEDKWRKVNMQWYPQLSVRVAADGSSRPVDFQVPAQADASRGRPANTEIELNTVPHILGLEEATQPASQPASRDD